MAESRRIPEQLGEMVADYKSHLPALVAELQASVGTAAEGSIEPQLLQQALSLAHRLKGTAGAYGFREVSRAAGEVERALKRFDGASECSKRDWAALRAALDELESEQAPTSLCWPQMRMNGVSVRVLVIDDDPDFLRHIELLGKSVSLEVLAAENVQRAIQLANEHPIDFALVDMQLGTVGDAARVIRDLRATPGSGLLPIACMSADDSIVNRVSAVQAGANLFFAKPLDGDELAAFVRRMVDHRVSDRSRILIVDDDTTSCRILKAMLERAGWQVSVLTAPERLLQTLQEVVPDLVVLDVQMSISGFDLCKVLRASPGWQELPVVFLTAADDPETAISCYRAGGDDYLVKPVELVEVVTRIRRRLERSQLFQQRAHEDQLTGLLTRAAFVDTVERRLAEAARRSRSLSVALIDLDHFKSINDTHGHLAGDRVLRSFARLVRSAFRVDDVRGRWGGEEFMVALYEEEGSTTAMVLQRLLRRLHAQVFEADDMVEFRATFSAGIASFPEDGSTLEALVRSADSRLYDAKHAGRARIVDGTGQVTSLGDLQAQSAD